MQQDLLEKLLEMENLDETAQADLNGLTEQEQAELLSQWNAYHRLREAVVVREAALRKKSAGLHAYAMQQIEADGKNPAARGSLRAWGRDRIDQFCGWVIWRLDLMKNRDQVLAAVQAKIDWSGILRGTAGWALLMLLVLLPLLLMLRPGRSPRTSSPALVNAPHYELVRSGDREEMVDYNERIQIAMAPRTVFERISPVEIRVRQGSVWLDVNRDGKGFIVDSKQGQFRVTGTSFGISQSESDVTLEVAEGSVEYLSAQDAVPMAVTAGQRLSVGAQGELALTQRDNLFSRPGWVAANSGFSPLLSSTPPILMGCQLSLVPDGMVLKCQEEGAVLWKLDRPLRQTIDLTFSMRNRPPFEEDQELQNDHNGFLVLANGLEPDQRMNLGMQIHAGELTAFSGGSMIGVGGESVLLERKLGDYELVAATVRLNFEERWVEISAAGQSLRQPLPDGWNEIKYLGFYSRRSEMAYRPLKTKDLDAPAGN